MSDPARTSNPSGDHRQEVTVQDVMFLVYEYANIREGLDEAVGEKRAAQRREMQRKANEIRAILEDWCAHETTSHEQELAFQTLSMYGVPRDRAKTVHNGIAVLAERFRKEDQFIAMMAADAEKWRALRNCARMKIMGAANLTDAAGLAQPDAHLGLELWTHHEGTGDAQHVQGCDYLDRFMVKALRVAQTTGGE